MKTATVALLVLMLASIGTTMAQDKAPAKGKVEQKMLMVQGNQAWTPTGFTLAPGDRVTVTAGGKVYFCSGAADSGVGPEGWPVATYKNAWPDDWNMCDDPLQAVDHAALIAEVGGQKFLVGPSKTFSGKGGLFYLGINDCSLTGEYHNTGQFNVTLKVERNVVPTPAPKP